MNKNAQIDLQVFIDRFVDAFITEKDVEQAGSCLKAMLDVAFMRGQNDILKEIRGTFSKISNELKTGMGELDRFTH